MQLTSAILSTLAMSGISLAAPSTPAASTNTITWASNDWTAGSYLATLYILWGEIGEGPIDYTIYGKPGVCYDIPPASKTTADFQHATGSIRVNAGLSCWAYAVAGCPKNAKYQTATAPQGLEVSEGNLLSIICVNTPAGGSK